MSFASQSVVETRVTQKTKLSKAKEFTFQLLKNGVRFKTVKAATFGDAKGKARKLYGHLKQDYLEIKDIDGRITPLFLE